MRAAERLIDAAGEDRLGDNVATRCRYELIFASVRGVGSFSTRIDRHARTLLESAFDSDDPGLHLDASVVLMCCGGMWGRHGTSLTGREVQDYHRRLRDRVDELIADVDRSVYRLRHARLIAAAAHLAMHPQWGEVEQPPPGTLPPAFADGDPDTSTLVPVDDPPFDVDEAMGRLAAFADVASDARGLPIQQLSKIFDLLAPRFAADPRYPKIRDALDAATAELHGDSEAGTRARDRGVALREAGRPLLALRELHKAKIRWFHGDTLRGALLTMIVIAKVYRDLGLPHAAKQYALAAAATALTAAEPDEVADIVAPAIVQGSITSYDAGAWFDAVALGHIGRMAHAHLAEHAFDYDEHAELKDIDLTELFVVSAAQTYRPDLLNSLERTLAPIAALRAQHEIFSANPDGTYEFLVSESALDRLEHGTSPTVALDQLAYMVTLMERYPSVSVRVVRYAAARRLDSAPTTASTERVPRAATCAAHREGNWPSSLDSPATLVISSASSGSAAASSLSTKSPSSTAAFLIRLVRTSNAPAMVASRGRCSAQSQAGPESLRPGHRPAVLAHVDHRVTTFDTDLVVADELPAEGDRAVASLLDSQTYLELVLELEGAVVGHLG
jgi:hypothetical protein